MRAVAQSGYDSHRTASEELKDIKGGTQPVGKSDFGGGQKDSVRRDRVLGSAC